jgi:hypothetical protein
MSSCERVFNTISLLKVESDTSLNQIIYIELQQELLAYVQVFYFWPSSLMKSDESIGLQLIQFASNKSGSAGGGRTGGLGSCMGFGKLNSSQCAPKNVSLQTV